MSSISRFIPATASIGQVFRAFAVQVFALPERGSNILLLWERRSAQRASLKSIDRRLLDDMGITEAEARHESDKPFWRA